MREARELKEGIKRPSRAHVQRAHGAIAFQSQFMTNSFTQLGVSSD